LVETTTTNTATMARPITLGVSNMPSNRLALTNRVYLSPTIYNFLLEALPSSSSSPPLISVNNHVYIAESNPEVPQDKIALNGLQRRFAQLSLAATVEIKPFVPPRDNYALAAMEVNVDLLAKKSTSGGKPREIDTDRLAADFLLNFEHQVFEVGMVLAMDFEGTKLELSVDAVHTMNLDGAAADDNNGSTTGVQGQFLSPTAVTFGKGSNLVTLTGGKIAGGGGGGNTIFLSDFDFEKLGIGGLDAEFNQIFRRAFASRIWPAHVIKQMGINHVRGMLVSCVFFW
jgi:vesicle-fusing ATPase